MKSLPYGLLLSLLLLSGGCSGLASRRDYLSEMEHDDSSFYSPNRDFPVIAGDSGRTSETEKERRLRTPASVEDKEQTRSRDFLAKELRQLESAQSEEAFAQYEDHKPKLKTTSERIYFLKLTKYERKEYLSARGFIKEDQQKFKPLEKRFGIRNTQVSMGMSKSEVENSLGRPARVEVAGNPSFENERWLYSVNGATKYIYFEAGRVEGWE